MDFEQLKQKAGSLPMAPGVYLMRDQSDSVIYVGKAKKLKNRVSQYFQDTASHSPKTKLMVSKIDHFDVIIAASEFEALVLECSLIKRYLPKYNILLKDDKGYPYLRVDMREAYPVLSLVNKVADDGAEYYGPYGSRGVTQDLLNTLQQVLKLPTCSKQFPRDLGKGRTCLNYHMGQCSGWCQKSNAEQAYRETIEIVRQLLRGNFKTVAEEIKAEMLQASEALNFELAASLRDRLRAVEKLSQKQLVTAGTLADTDVVGFYQTGTIACFTILHFSGGNLLDKEYETFPATEEPVAAVSTLLKQYYFNREFAPKQIFLPFGLDDIDLFAQLMRERFNRVSHFKTPQRGDNLRLVEMAINNAKEEAERITTKEDRMFTTLQMLGKMLAIPHPERIEAFDISHISGTDIVGSMVVFSQGRAAKSEYKRFKLEGLSEQDDYASMRQVVQRRFEHYKCADRGFEAMPNLLLIDGGVAHAQTVSKLLSDMEIFVPVYGMVKDTRHRTRALVTPDGNEVWIDSQQSIFAFIGNIQEETHRFAITYHRNLRSKRLKMSELDEIPGIGPKRKQELLSKFKSLAAIKKATLTELEYFLPKNAAKAVYEYFQTEKERG